MPRINDIFVLENVIGQICLKSIEERDLPIGKVMILVTLVFTNGLEIHLGKRRNAKILPAIILVKIEPNMYLLRQKHFIGLIKAVNINVIEKIGSNYVARAINFMIWVG